MANTRNYWNNRYSSNERSRASGTFVHSENANRWFYKAKQARVRQILKAAQIELPNRSVMDVACGTGAFIPLWLELGASRIMGVDISDKAVEMCRQRFASHKQCEFKCVDLASDPPASDLGAFDFICIFEAIFLLTVERDFVAALNKLCSWLKPGGHLLISDRFPETTMARHERLTYYSRSTYERVFKDHNVQIVRLARQTAMFNRHIFPEKVQAVVERTCPWLIFLLNRLMLNLPARNGGYMDEIYYCLAQKQPGPPS